MKIFVLVVILYFLAIFEISFLAHFPVWGRTPALTMAFILAWNLFEGREEKSGYLMAVSGGFFLDVFSNGIIGIHAALMLILCAGIKLILKKHVRIPFAQET